MSLRVMPRIYNNENLILEKLVHEAIAIHSISAYYIPREFVSQDLILGEDRLSEFKYAYPIDIYLESYDGFEGQNAFASKFGLQIDSTAKILISRKEWKEKVGRSLADTNSRPEEGSLIYIPMTKGLFEINFADHQQPFYQLGQFYSYKLTIQLFRYSSEKIDTNIPDIDKFETVHTTDTALNPSGDIQRGADNSKFVQRANGLVWDQNNPFGDI